MHMLPCIATPSNACNKNQGETMRDDDLPPTQPPSPPQPSPSMPTILDEPQNDELGRHDKTTNNDDNISTTSIQGDNKCDLNKPKEKNDNRHYNTTIYQTTTSSSVVTSTLSNLYDNDKDTSNTDTAPRSTITTNIPINTLT